MSSMATILAALRLDLDDVGELVWADDLLERAIEKAVLQYSQVLPLESLDTLQTDSNARTVDVSTLTPRVRIVAAEYPTAQYPPSYVPFSQWADTLTLDLETAPTGTPDVNIYWHAVHAINGSVTFDAAHDDIIAIGAAAFAVNTAGNARANSVNTGGENVWGRYVEFADRRKKEFEEALAGLAGAGKLKTRRLYTPEGDVRFTSQTTDPGPQ